jgi:hypothetical protein
VKSAIVARFKVMSSRHDKQFPLDISEIVGSKPDPITNFTAPVTSPIVG